MIVLGGPSMVGGFYLLLRIRDIEFNYINECWLRKKKQTAGQPILVD